MHKYMYSQSEPGKVVHVGTLLTQGVRVFLIFSPPVHRTGLPPFILGQSR